MNYTDVFGNSAVPPSQQSYSTYSLTADTQAYWPDNYSGTGLVLTDIVEVTPTGVYSITMPSAAEVSVGRDLIIRNLGTTTINVLKSDASALTTVEAGQAVLIYVTDNSTDAGTWGQFTYGAGTSYADAASLEGNGIKAVGTTLNQAHPITAINSDYTIATTDRSKLVLFTGGVAEITLPVVATVGEDFFFLLRNGGTGNLEITPNGSETIDDLITFNLNPGESTIVCASGTEWFTVGYGRSTSFNFTQLTKDISAGGTITLTAAEASNKLLTFTGSPAADVTIVVPSTVQVYYVYNKLSTAKNVIIKTAAGSGTSIPQSARVIVYCDAINVVGAQSVAATSTISFEDGNAAAPSINFASKTNSGIYKAASQDVGIAVNGSSVAVFTSAGLTTAASGNLTSTNLNAALAELQADIDTVVGGTIPDASTTVKGKVELATVAEAQAGIDTVRAVTPAGLAAVITTLTSYATRSWVNFNGTNTVAIRGSGNVSSITDNGTGSYTVNFSTAMPDANYAVVNGGNNKETDAVEDYPKSTQILNLTTSSFSSVHRTGGSGTSLIDPFYAMFAVFR